MSEGRHAGRGRARRPKTGYLSLDASRRHRILSNLVLGRAIDAADQPYARDKAERTVSKLPQALVTGLMCGAFAVGSWSSLFPLTVGTGVLLACFGLAIAIYLAGMIFGIRMWFWLRRRPVHGDDS